MGTQDSPQIDVLYVGHGDSADTVTAAFGRAGVNATVVSSVADVASALSPEIDCVVTEATFDAGDAKSVVQTVNEFDLDLPLIVYSHGASEALASKVTALGITFYRLVAETDADELTADVLAAVRAHRSRLETPVDELRLKQRAMNEAPVGIAISDATQPDNPLTYVNDSFVEMTGYTETEIIGRNCRFLQGEDSDPAAVTAMRQAIAAEEEVAVVVKNYRKDGEMFWNRVNIAPIRDADGEVRHFVGFQNDVTARKEAELALAEEREQLAYLLDRIQGLIQDVTQTLVRSVNREEIEETVCTQLANADPYVYAWVGEVDVAANEVVPTQWSGEALVSVGDIGVSLSDPDSANNPVARAVKTGTMQTARVGVRGFGRGYPKRVVEVAAVPLVYEDVTYGVLTVCADREDVFNSRERVILESVGRAVASGINSLESKKIITADNIVEVELEFESTALFFVDIASKTGAELEFKQAMYQPDDSLVLFFTATGADPEVVEAAARECGEIANVQLVATGDDESLFELTLARESIVTDLANYGAKTQAITAHDRVGRMKIELPQEANVRQLVELVKKEYPGTELVSYREHDRRPTTKQEFVMALRERLTERQLSTLQRAYVAGFFDWPRPVNGDDLAATMGVSRSTFHEHLRAAERKLCAELFERPAEPPLVRE
ncbi:MULTISPECIES: bacterio-opsin activator domain-containing protein [unclassified Haladaptatus]|uniref:bacterio-opsin activator domain-containing protein n=1 Tax=unclassified Haladaptatus TaxID=2622732 RepID=UPI0023E84552|nr:MULTISPECIES: bacterio-opsin activator domain-containing protein [unclassified Haladaptatus]